MEMAELPILSSAKKTTSPQQHYSNFLIPILILVSSFILSHPLYFLKLLSFLSPLLITTFLIILFTSYRALRRSVGNGHGEKGESDDEVHQSHEDDEVYKIFFEAPCLEDHGMQEESEELVDKFLISIDDGNPVGGYLEDLQDKEDGNTHNGDVKKGGSVQPEKTLEELFNEKEDGECGAVQTVEEKVVEKTDVEAKEFDLSAKTEECASKAWRNSRRLSNSLRIFERSAGVLGDDEKMGLVHCGFGSMRRNDEKEWKRTLACKLFEERHSNSEGGGSVRDNEEGMDMLWEAYEKVEAPASVPEPENRKKAAKESAKKMRKKVEEVEEQEDGDEEEEEEEMNGQLCCLQALKLSAGKVNLGMGKPNMARISKAFRGFGWLHHGRSRKGLRV